MDASDVSAEQWKQIDARVTAAWREAFELCQWIVNHDMPIDDPLYHHAGAMLGAICDMRRLMDRAQDGRLLPEVARGAERELIFWVKPQDGGGCVPRKG